MLNVDPLLEARVQFSALVVALVRAGQFDAVEALWEWAEEYLDIEREQLEEELKLDA